MKRNRHFNFWHPYEDEQIRIEGYVTPYIPATGPSMENAGGDPAEGGEIEDFKAFRMVNGVEVEIEDTAAILKAMEDAISEDVSGDDDGPDPDERHDARMAGD